MNVHLAQYGCSQMLHAGKLAYTHIATNVQELQALIAQDNHLAIVISHTGENLRLGEIIKTLRCKHTKTIVISAYKNRTLCNMGDEFIYVASTEGADKNKGCNTRWNMTVCCAGKWLYGKWSRYLDRGILRPYNLSKKHRNVSFV